jgi:hypothetical protein
LDMFVASTKRSVAKWRPKPPLKCVLDICFGFAAIKVMGAKQERGSQTTLNLRNPTTAMLEVGY